MDWPDADDHFTLGIQRLTRIETGAPIHFRLTDDRLYEYPWIYATQTGWWGLSEAETARLREYLLRGGFLVVDDFWGLVLSDLSKLSGSAGPIQGEEGLRLAHGCPAAGALRQC